MWCLPAVVADGSAPVREAVALAYVPVAEERRRYETKATYRSEEVALAYRAKAGDRRIYEVSAELDAFRVVADIEYTTTEVRPDGSYTVAARHTGLTLFRPNPEKIGGTFPMTTVRYDRRGKILGEEPDEVIDPDPLTQALETAQNFEPDAPVRIGEAYRPSPRPGQAGLSLLWRCEGKARVGGKEVLIVKGWGEVRSGGLASATYFVSPDRGIVQRAQIELLTSHWGRARHSTSP